MPTAQILVKDHKSKLYAPNSVISLLRNNPLLRYENDFWVRKNSSGYIPKYRKLVRNNGTFLTGLLKRVTYILDKKDIRYEIKDKRRVQEAPSLDHIKTMIGGLKIDDNKLTLRDYQRKSVIKGIKNTRGIFELATGAGKTIILAALLRCWYKKSLVIIDSKDLAYQLQDDIANHTGEGVGFVGDGIWNPKRITVGIDRTLLSDSKKEKKKNFLDSIECLMFDEVHHLQSKTWRKLCRRCPKASIRFGFSATPQTSSVKLESGGEGNKNEVLEGYLGPTLVSLSAGDLVKLGWLAEPTIYFAGNNLPFDGNTMESYQEEYARIITKDDERNETICEFIEKHYEQDEQVIGFIKRINHGDRLVQMLEDRGVPPSDFEFVHGNHYGRDEAIENFKDGSKRILLGTVLSEGLDFSCDVGINIEAGKSSIATKQKIGRILRKSVKQENGDVDPNTPEYVKYYDFWDRGHPYFRKHAYARKEVYEEEDFEIVNLG